MGPGEGSLSTTAQRARALGKALAGCDLAEKGNESPEACKGLFPPTGRLLTALIKEWLLSPAQTPSAPAAPLGACCRGGAI